MALKTTQIKALILFLLPLIIVSATSNDFSIILNDPSSSSEDNLLSLFEQWVQTHERTYAQPADKQRGFENFARNFAFAQERNSKREEGSHVVGLNKFADLSNEEFRAKHISKVRMGRNRERKVELRSGRRGDESCDAPASLDWRTKAVVTPVKNQAQCGSCWAFSSTGAMESANAIATGELISLSEQELVDCVSTNWGCNGGYMDYAFEWVVENGGIDTESDYVYTALDGACNMKEANKVVTINGYEDVEWNDAALLCAVAKQPVSVGIDASTLDFQLYTGGVYNGNCSSEWEDIDHAVLIVGYGSENNVDYWIVKNSWGTNWGDEGYIKIKRNKDLETGTCAINAMASYPTIKSVVSSS